MDKLLSVAYSECEGTKSGEKELAFISAVFDFLNRQSTYLSDPKIADQLTQLTANTISAGSKKKDAINKKKKDKKKKKKESSKSKGDTKTNNESSSKSDGKKKGKKKKGKSHGSKPSNSENGDDNESKETEIFEEPERINVVERVESMYKEFTFDINKDYKSMIRNLGKVPSKRSAFGYVLEICTVIRLYAPSVSVNRDLTKSIVGTDRAFRVSTNMEGNIYISDFEMAYILVDDPKNDKVLNADLVSNHPVCVHDASSVHCDHRSNVFFHEKTTFKNESLSVIIPGKPTPKRALQYKPLGIYSMFPVHASTFNVTKDLEKSLHFQVSTWIMASQDVDNNVS